MIDGATEVVDRDKTASNKAIVEAFMKERVSGGDIASYFADACIDHEASPRAEVSYGRVYKIFGEGNFVLAMSECHLRGDPTAFFDLWRLENGKLVEHWDTIEPILPEEDRKNTNGKL